MSAVCWVLGHADITDKVPGVHGHHHHQQHIITITIIITTIITAPNCNFLAACSSYSAIGYFSQWSGDPGLNSLSEAPENSRLSIKGPGFTQVSVQDIVQGHLSLSLPSTCLSLPLSLPCFLRKIHIFINLKKEAKALGTKRYIYILHPFTD